MTIGRIAGRNQPVVPVGISAGSQSDSSRVLILQGQGIGFIIHIEQPGFQVV